MNSIKINNEYYGVTDSSLLKYKETTVHDELESIEALLAEIPNARILTQAEYNALGDAVNNDDVVYYITDAGIDGAAINLSYDNKLTKMNANNVQDAIDLCFQSVNDGKKSLATSLTKCGIPIANEENFDNFNTRTQDMLDYQTWLGTKEGTDRGIAESRGGTALPEHVLSGVEFSSTKAAGLKGTMPNNGAISATLTAGKNDVVYNIPKGYHDGKGTVAVAAEQEKLSSMSLTINQACYYKGDSGSWVPINVQGYNKMSRKIDGYNNVRMLELNGYKEDGTYTTISSSVANLDNIDISQYYYLSQEFMAKEKSSSPYVSTTFTISV